MASDEQQTQVERELTLYRQTLDGRDDMIRRALAAGITKNRIHVLTGIARTTIDRVVNSKESPVGDGSTGAVGEMTDEELRAAGISQEWSGLGRPGAFFGSDGRKLDPNEKAPTNTTTPKGN